jgi:polysaccharide export outer membrane protein
MTIRVRTLAAAALLLAPSLGCRTTYGSPVATDPTEVYRVGAPDQLLITVLPEPVISRNVRVRPDGMISFDLVGDVPAAGRTPTEIAKDVETRIGRYKRDASVTVFLAGSSSTTVTILGEAGRQTTFALPRDTRLIEVMGAVGGWRISAAASRIRIIRLKGGEPEIFGADLDAIVKGDLRTNYLLRGGDIIFIPRNLSAAIGLAVGKLLFPMSSVISLGIQGGRIAIMVQTGGAAALAGKAFGGLPLGGLAGAF